MSATNSPVTPSIGSYSRLVIEDRSAVERPRNCQRLKSARPEILQKQKLGEAVKITFVGRMSSLESIEFFDCTGITDAGIACLARLPHLREITVGGSPNVTREGMAVFPAVVRANYW